jgi:hypothetical protein
MQQQVAVEVVEEVRHKQARTAAVLQLQHQHQKQPTAA